MNEPYPGDLSDMSMLELFRIEAENQTGIMTNGLLELERLEAEKSRTTDGQKGAPSSTSSHKSLLESLMRAAHSLKGAARIIDLPAVGRVAHAIEDCFVAAQQGDIRLEKTAIDVLLSGVDLLSKLAKCETTELSTWGQTHAEEIETFLAKLSSLMKSAGKDRSAFSAQPPQTQPPAAAARETSGTTCPEPQPQQDDGTAPAYSEPAGPPGEQTGSKPTEGGTETFPSQGSSAGEQTGFETTVLEIASAGPETPGPGSQTTEQSPPVAAAQPSAQAPDRVVRITAENLNHLLALAGESLVESHWLHPFTQSMFRLKQMQAEVSQMLEQLRGELEACRAAGLAGPPAMVGGRAAPERLHARLYEVFERLNDCRDFLVQRLEDLDSYDRRSARLSHRLYHQALKARMRPFGDGLRRFPRMVRDLARALGKQIRLEIVGEKTSVDRDILEQLETPLAHLVRNAIDHGCQTPEERRRAGKDPENLLRIEARHSAGMLLVSVSDDGAGIDLQKLREKIVQRKLTTPALAEKMSQSELLEFLFLPGFTMRETVTELSGRGVGLDVVQSMVKSVRGTIRVSTKLGRGTRFQLQLPLTLSVVRALLVEICGEPYAIPLGQIERTVRVARDQIETLEGRQHFTLDGEHIGLVVAWQVLDLDEESAARAFETEMSPWQNAPFALPIGPFDRQRHLQQHALSVIVLNAAQAGRTGCRYGFVVDRVLGERELVVQPLDKRLGKVQDISAAALMEDGAPVLILDVEDLLRTIERLLACGQMVGQASSLTFAGSTTAPRRKRVLAVDDSLTVRELERKLLASRGYIAEVAVDGMDAWNAVRSGNYDLVITDIDMPRMDGIELATLIKNDPQLKSLPVVIVSYKDSEQDRLRGLNAGADYYLTKGSFHDETLLKAVQDLIGEPEK